MSIAQTAQQLKTLLEGISAPRLAKVYATPREAADIASWPCAVISIDPAATHAGRIAAHALARHDYTMAIWVFVGVRDQVPLNELYSRCEPWPEPILAALMADYQLKLTNGQPGVTSLGDGTDTLFTYEIGVHEWAGRNLFGLKFSLKAWEKFSAPMNP